MYKVLIFLACIFTFQIVLAKKVPVQIILNSGDTLSGTITGYKKEFISPYTTIKADRKYNLEEIHSIIIVNSGLQFVVIKTSVYEDETYVLAKSIDQFKAIGLISFRQCTCNQRYQVTKAYFLNNGDDHQLILKHLFRDKILRKRGAFFGVNANQFELLAPVQFRFSSIPEVL